MEKDEAIQRPVVRFNKENMRASAYVTVIRTTYLGRNARTLQFMDNMASYLACKVCMRAIRIPCILWTGLPRRDVVNNELVNCAEMNLIVKFARDGVLPQLFAWQCHQCYSSARIFRIQPAPSGMSWPCFHNLPAIRSTAIPCPQSQDRR
jgi:hypothetical protein